ncbi:GNAT family N-acetyltransferase [Amycolatopsis sp. NBC_01286]|uniref:GNAT family N-acetyltransferase n=1 Tax=Amycolatopsis sp. NBC_01286 TaxID=2903560 RepID=UPI002E1638ED|nr:GNAT family N-acetyltransferase [Amycolatopsis sp. NBC_01286]
MTLTIWRAGRTDCSAVLDLLLSRAAWLKSRGSDQWYNFDEKQDELEQVVSKGHTWLMRDGAAGTPLGTITFTDADPDFWTFDEQRTPALYLAKLATDPEIAGRGLGRTLLQFALFEAAANRVDEVRFDVWKTAYDLQRYYEREGWSHLRTVDLPHRNSGALFSRKVVKPVYNRPPIGLEVRPFTSAKSSSSSQTRTTWEPGEREHGGSGEL